LVIPGTLKVLAGKSKATFVGTTSQVSTVTPCRVRVTTAGDPYEVVVDVRPTVVKSLVIAPAMVIGGAKATMTITLTEAAPLGGALVMLSSTSANFPVTASVTIPAGKTSGVVTLQTPNVSTAENVQVTAQLGGGATLTTVSIVPVALASFTGAPASVKSGGSVVLTLKLAAVSSVPVEVVMTTSDAALISLPVKFTIPAGQQMLQQVVNVGVTAGKKSVVLTAGTQAVPKKLTVSVSP
jgi:hypothetical protein